VRDRLAAAEALGNFDLSPEQLAAAARLIDHCGPLEVSWLLHAFDRDAGAGAGLALVESLMKSPALASIPGTRLRELFKKYPAEVQSAAAKLFEHTDPDETERISRLASLQVAMQGGDAARGEEVFFNLRAACSACHRVAARGERIGPDLTKIGEVRNRRDLLEAIVFPSASLARGYESFSAVTKDGKVHSGLLSRETAAAVYLRTADRIEIRLERGDIDELTPSRTSIMPQGLEKALSPAQLRDVIAYLESLK